MKERELQWRAADIDGRVVASFSAARGRGVGDVDMTAII